MKSWGKMIRTALAVTLLLCISISSIALAKEDYTYTVTFYAGNQGTFDSTDGLSVNSEDASISQSGDKIVVSGLENGDVVSFNAQSAVDMDEDSKHYVQGVRLSGRDNDTVSASAFTVDEDKDFVVAYGIKGNVTSYTVYYQDADGDTLMEKDVFYGNVGDKPVVAYKYIEGYEPQVLGYTKTLSENETDNVFTFVYDRIETEDEVVVVPGENDDADDDTNVTTDATTDAGNADDNAAADNADDNADAQVDDGAAEGTDDDLIVDLDDEETPLANVDADNGGKGIPMAGMIAILIVALVALVNAGFFVKRRLQK